MRTHQLGAVAALPLTLLLVVSTAPPANAAITVNLGGQVVSDAVGDSITPSCVAGQFSVAGMTAGDACSDLDSISVNAQGGMDTVNLQQITAAEFPALRMISIDVDEGGVSEADNVTGSDLNEFIRGDFEDTISARGGHDLIDGANSASGGAGDDSFMNISTFASGGAGDDRFIQMAVPIDGGDGMDSWELDFDQLQLAVEGDPVVTFVLSGSDLTVDIADDALPAQVVPATGLDQVYFTLLRQGPQSWDGATFVGGQHVRGMAGPDVLTGGVGDDALFGGSDADVVTGGGGGDVLRGGDGNDTISARDGVVDRVDCGAGTDTVVADAADVVTGCESVQLPPVVAPPVVVPPVAVAPETSAIKGKRKVTKPRKAKFRFSSPTAGATFECRVDKGRWKTCSSTYKVKTKKLKTGKHTLRVRAVLGGVVDATPSKKKFKVKRRR